MSHGWFNNFISRFSCVNKQRPHKLLSVLRLFQGKRNYITLGCAVAFALTGSLCVGLSKSDMWHSHNTTISNMTTAAITDVVYVTTSA